MNKTKRLIVSVLFIVSVFMGAIGLASCGGFAPIESTNRPSAESQSFESSAESHKEKCIVTFCGYDGTVLGEEEVVYGQASALANEGPSREGYRFAGWGADLTKVTKDMTVTAQYVETVFVEFIDYDGSTIYSEMVDKGSSFTNIPQGPTRNNYKFDGWSENNFDKINEDMTVFAQYVRIYSVTFIDYNGDTLYVDEVLEGDNATAPPNPTREGYTFIKWDGAFVNVTEDITVKAIYDINKYTVSFVYPDGNRISEEVGVRHGWSVSLPSVPEFYYDWSKHKRGGFTGWKIGTEEIPSDKKVVATSNTTVTAVYDEEIAEPMIIARSVEVNKGSKEVSIKLYLSCTQKIYGLNLDVQFNNKLQLGGSASVKTEGAFGVVDAHNQFTTAISNDGKCEMRWINGKNPIDPSAYAGPVSIMTITFQLDEYQAVGNYLVEILDSTYLIEESFNKVTPIFVDGIVFVEDKEA